MKRAVYYVFRENGERYYNTFCECGFKHMKREEEIKVCEGCKEPLTRRCLYYDERDAGERDVKLEFDRYENALESQTGFEIYSLIDRYIFNGESFKFESVSKPYKLIVDFKNSNYKLVDRKNNESKITEGRCRQFFRGTWDFKKVLKLDSNKMFVAAIEPLGKLKTSYETSPSRAFDKAFKDEDFVRCVQILASANVPVSLISNLAISNVDGYYYYGYGYYYYGYGREINYEALNFNESEPHKILNTDKSNLEILKYWAKNTDYNEWIREVNKYNKNDIKYIINILENELGTSQAIEFFSCIKDFNELVYEYKYKPRELAKYLVRDVKLEQGIDKPQSAMTLLKDLNKMCRDMRVKPKEKLSRSLKLHHDIITMNYKVSVDTYKKNRFIDIVNKEEYKEKE